MNQNPTKKFEIWLGSSVQLWWVLSHTHTLRVVVGMLSKREMPARHSSLKPKIDLQNEREREVEEGKRGNTLDLGCRKHRDREILRELRFLGC